MPQFSVTTTAQLLVGYSEKRTNLVIFNEDVLAVVRISHDSVNISKEPPLYPKGNVTFAEAFGDNPKLPRYIIGSAACTVSYSEGFENA